MSKEYQIGVRVPIVAFRGLGMSAEAADLREPLSLCSRLFWSSINSIWSSILSADCGISLGDELTFVGPRQLCFVLSELFAR